MKRYKVHIICAIAACALLIIIRSTSTLDYAQKLSAWKAAVIAAAQQRYEQTKSFIGSQLISPVLIQVIKSQEKAIIDNPYKDMVATVRVGNELHADEREYRMYRESRVKAALEKLLDRSLDGKKIPVISCVASGGGYRAMLCTTGSMVGAEQIGLLDTFTYICALSGSTWALGPWIATGWTWADFRIYLEGLVIQTIFNINSSDARRIADVFATKLAFNQPITSVDLFGALLANRLLDGFGDDRQLLYLSHQAQRIKDGTFPYPIYTATDRSEKVAEQPHWYEFTPHEVGCAAFALYIPVWAYGREFYGGGSLDFAPEQTLGFILGTCGSAYALTVGFLWDSLADNISNVMLKQLIQEYVIAPMKGKRVFWAEVNNYMKGIASIANAYERLSERPILKIVDAGLTCNLPYPPVSGERTERKPDLLLFLDASAATIPGELKKVEEYARKHNIKFPVIDYTDLNKKTFAVFKDETDAEVPVVIYMPRITDAALWQTYQSHAEFAAYSNLTGFDMEKCTNEKGQVCNTLNFEYTQEQAQQVMNQTQFNMVVNKDNLKEVLNWVIDRN